MPQKITRISQFTSDLDLAKELCREHGISEDDHKVLRTIVDAIRIGRAMAWEEQRKCTMCGKFVDGDLYVFRNGVGSTCLPCLKKLGEANSKPTEPLIPGAQHCATSMPE